MNTKFNIETAKKLLSVYAENVNFYIRENKMLKNQLKDIQISLQINKELLFKELNMKFKDSDIISSIKKENERLSKFIETLYKEKFDLENKYIQIKEKLDNLIMEKNNLNDIQSTEIFRLKNLIQEKENIILCLNKELNNSFEINYIKEIILEPNIAMVEINNELVESRQLIKNYTKILQNEKLKNENLEKKIVLLKNKIISLKKKKKIKEKMENIEMFDYIITSNSNNDSNLNHSLDSPTIEFPEKIKQKKYLKTDISESNLPKLDFSKLLLNYPPLKEINIIEYDKKSENYKDDYIEKIEFDLKYFKNKCHNLKKKNNELKNNLDIIKNKYINLKNSIPITNSTKETEVEKNKLIKVNQITNNYIKNNYNENISLEVNSSQIDVDSMCESSDFNYIIKEYNKI